MHIASLLHAICADLTRTFPGLAACTPCLGDPVPQAFPEGGGDGPRAWVALSGADTALETATGEWDLPLSIEAVVAGPVTPDAAFLNLVEGLLAHIPGTIWGLATAHPAGGVEARGCPSHPLASGDRAVWTLSWNQMLRLGDALWAAPAQHPTRLFTGLAPNIGPGHEDDYTTLEVTP
ncbi:hypothetical protein [Desulfoluna spongiiphila]|uniref:Uncharacterized protein n=1 Tax=Desulfoluna spongiiphila TaxID=419481 RepID=A0A1G5ACN2_9BACT|nr:hypothetical protein [Desulfoluna spongiiphila]SCX75622.1 hypothetical protein SAMN05216233_10148 [Desulfoluna spongiiphila]